MAVYIISYKNLLVIEGFAKKCWALNPLVWPTKLQPFNVHFTYLGFTIVEMKYVVVVGNNVTLEFPNNAEWIEVNLLK